MRILVTGGAGFVGATLVRQAVSAGHDVLNFDALTASATLADIWDLEEQGNYTLVPGDVTDASGFRDVVKSFAPDAIVHLAQEGPHSLTDDPAATLLDTNVMGVETVLRIAKEEGVEKTVLSHLNPPTSQAASQRYPASKQAALLVSQAFVQRWAVAAVHTFAPQVFGPRQSPIDPISITIDRLMDGRTVVIPNGPRTAMDLVYVDDYAKGLLSVAEGGRVGDHYQFVGPRKIRPLGIGRQICNALQSYYPNADSKFVDLLEIRDVVVAPSPKHAQQAVVTTIKGKTPFHRAVTRTVDWQLENANQISRGRETGVTETLDLTIGAVA